MALASLLLFAVAEAPLDPAPEETAGTETLPPNANVRVFTLLERPEPVEDALPVVVKLALPARYQADRGVPTYNRFSPLAAPGEEADVVAPPTCAVEEPATCSGVAEVFLGGGAKLGTAATSRRRHASRDRHRPPSPAVPSTRSPSCLQKGGCAARSVITGPADDVLLVDWSGPRLPKEHASGAVRQAQSADGIDYNPAIGCTATIALRAATRPPPATA